jgi:hypothetical protein
MNFRIGIFVPLFFQALETAEENLSRWQNKTARRKAGLFLIRF